MVTNMLEEFNPESPTQLSILLYGGIIKITVKEPMLNSDGSIMIIKSGPNKNQIKMKNQIKEIKFAGLGITPLEDTETKKEGIYKTDEGTLKLILENLENG